MGRWQSDLTSWIGTPSLAYLCVDSADMGVVDVDFGSVFHDGPHDQSCEMNPINRNKFPVFTEGWCTKAEY